MKNFLKRIFSKKTEQPMETKEYISPLEAAELELAAAQQRLDLAHGALRRFETEHCAVIDGRRCYVSADPTVRVSLDRERHALLIEIDEATRVWQKALADWRELLPPRTCIAPAEKSAENFTR